MGIDKTLEEKGVEKPTYTQYYHGDLFFEQIKKDGDNCLPLSMPRVEVMDSEQFYY